MSIKYKCGELTSIPGARFAVLKFSKGSVFAWCVMSPGQLDSLCLGFPVPSSQSTASVLIDDQSADRSLTFVKRVSKKVQVPVFASIPEAFPASVMSQVESELVDIIQSM